MDHQNNVLLVEDSSDDITYLKEIFFDNYPNLYKLNVCRNLESALTQSSNKVPDLILLDLNLPDSRGKETVFTILNVYPSTPIVIMTDEQNEQLMDQTIDLGIHDYVTKGQLTHDAIKRIVSFALARNNYYNRLNGQNKALHTMTQKLRKQVVSKELKSSSQEVKHLLHEIHGSLSLMSGSIEMLNESHKNDDVFNTLNKSFCFLKAIIDQELEHKEQERLLMDILRDAFNISKHNAELKGLKLNLNLSGSLWWTKDGIKLQQVILNLITNAIKYTQKGNIDISFQEGETCLTIVVKDTGMGIPLKKQDKIFEDKVRLDVENSTGSSHGHGLFISNQIIKEFFQGSIVVESEVNQGSTFTITMPKNSFYVKKSLRNNILLIDDCEDFTNLVKIFLNNNDSYIDIARSFEDALKKASKYKFDLIIADFNINGEVLTQYEAEFNNLKHSSPIVIMSGERKLDIDLNGFKYNDYLQKPVKKDDLLKVVERFQKSSRQLY